MEVNVNISSVSRGGWDCDADVILFLSFCPAVTRRLPFDIRKPSPPLPSCFLLRVPIPGISNRVQSGEVSGRPTVEVVPIVAKEDASGFCWSLSLGGAKLTAIEWGQVG